MSEAAEAVESVEVANIGVPDIEYTEPEPVQPVKKAKDLVDRAVFVSIRLHKPGSSKKISSQKITFESELADEPPAADFEVAEEDEASVEAKHVQRKVSRDMITVSKKLIRCEEYQKIAGLDSRIKRYIKSRCTDSLIRDGIFLLPVQLIADLDKKMLAFTQLREQYIAEYGEVYEQRVEEALEKLGPEGDRRDYPPWAAVRQQYSLEFQYITMGAPTVLGNISQRILEREQEKIQEKFKVAVDASRDALRTGMADLVAKLAAQLSTDEADAKKTLRKQSVDNVKEFLSLFDARNLADDESLANLVKKANNLLEGVDVKVLKDDAALRVNVAKGFMEIQNSLQSLVVDIPTRAISFED